MKYAKIFWTVVLCCLAFLLSDGLPEAQAMPPAQGDQAWQQGDGETLVARSRRRRRRRRRRRKTKPKPKPKPEPKEEAPPEAPAGNETAVPMGPGGRARVDFEAQLIKGQTTKSGEVQILARKDSELKSMVMRRTSFRDEIIETVFPEKAGK